MAEVTPEAVQAAFDEWCETDEFKEAVDSIFNDFDLDDSGSVEKSELTLVSKMMAPEFEKQGLKSPEVTDEQIESTFTELDVNNDGKLSKEEMGPFVKKLIFVMIRDNFEAFVKSIVFCSNLFSGSQSIAK